MSEKPTPKVEIEELSDAWERFENAFDTVMKARPMPKAAPKAKDGPASNGRVHKAKARS